MESPVIDGVVENGETEFDDDEKKFMENPSVVIIETNSCNQESSRFRIQSASSSFSQEKNSTIQKSNLYQLCVKCTKFFPSSTFIATSTETDLGKEAYSCTACFESDVRDDGMIHNGNDSTGQILNPKENDGNEMLICDNEGTNSVSHGNECIEREQHQKMYACNICGKSFSRSDSLHVHKRTHSGEKPYICTTCSRGFQTSSHLKKHYRVHSGEKPYQCGLCDSRFSESSSLNRHMLIHSGEKDYECEICKKRFSLSQSLARHSRCHTGEKPYTCTICNQSFTAISTLNVHKRIHSGERPYECLTCDKRFYTNGHLVKHQRVHSGEKPYKCDTCERPFSDSSSLKRHTSSHLRIKKDI